MPYGKYMPYGKRRRMFQTILVALGANLPAPDGASPLATCQWAVGKLAAIPGLRLNRVSRWFATRPMPASDQPDFTNGVAWLSGTIDPADLLAALHEIEAAAGRVRTGPNGARTLDLDLLAMDGLIVSIPTLTLPHPRLQDRAFVLRPLLDVVPGWRHPVSGRTVEALLGEVSTQVIEPQVIEPL